MNVQEILATIEQWVPRSMRATMVGRRPSPRKLSNLIHAALNLTPGERYPVLPCGGVLKGFKMRIDWNIHRSFVTGSWEPEVVNAVQRYVSRGMTALDIGAQSGFYSLLLSRLVGPEGSVIAFEPLPANYRLLDENIHLNNLNNVAVYHEAVTEHSGEITFEFPLHEPWLVAGPVLDGDSLRSFAAKGVSLDDFIAENSLRVHVVKMDVEGAETDILRGASKMLEELHPCLIIELHFTNGLVHPHPAVPILEGSGYDIQWLDVMGHTAHVVAQWRRRAL